MISIHAHNIIDYCLAASYLLAPYIFGFAGVYFAQDVFTVIGFTILGYSLLTDYKFSMARAVPLGMHRVFDVIIGLFTMFAPRIYGYRELLTPLQSAMHWVFGLAIIAVAVLSKRYHAISEEPSALTTDTKLKARQQAAQSKPRRAA